MSQLTTFLFASPSFFEGAGRLFDFGGTMTEYNRSPNGQVADALAIGSDWRAVGEDIAQAMKVCSPEGADEQEQEASRG